MRECAHDDHVVADLASEALLIVQASVVCPTSGASKAAARSASAFSIRLQTASDRADQVFERFLSSPQLAARRIAFERSLSRGQSCVDEERHEYKALISELRREHAPSIA